MTSTSSSVATGSLILTTQTVPTETITSWIAVTSTFSQPLHYFLNAACQVTEAMKKRDETESGSLVDNLCNCFSYSGLTVTSSVYETVHAGKTATTGVAITTTITSRSTVFITPTTTQDLTYTEITGIVTPFYTVGPEYCTQTVNQTGLYVRDTISDQALMDDEFSINTSAWTQFEILSGNLTSVYDLTQGAVPFPIQGGKLVFSADPGSEALAILHCQRNEDKSLACFNYGGTQYQWYKDSSGGAHLGLSVPSGYTSVSPQLA